MSSATSLAGDRLVVPAADPPGGHPHLRPVPDAPARSVALVHDYLTQRGGAERAVLAMHEAFPDAPLHTSLYDPTGTFPEFDDVEVVTSPLDRVGTLRRSHRLALPFLAPTFRSMRVDADVVLCSSSGWAHGVSASGHKVVYCHAPARWLYQAESYLEGFGCLSSAVVRSLTPALRGWDRRAARSADSYLANSTRTRDLLRAVYGIDAPVLHPPHGIDESGPYQPVAGLDEGFHLCVARLLSYKHVDKVIQAFEGRPGLRLVIVGEGPAAGDLRASAPSNVRLLGRVDDAELRWLYRSAQALISASYEDFGLTPIEAAAFGTPSIVLRFGGYLDTIVEGRTGLFFDRPDAKAITDAVTEAEATRFDPSVLRQHAAGFTNEVFAQRLHDVVDAC
jgi:glycosyltransferase involved in cell wall biosynthesis